MNPETLRVILVRPEEAGNVGAAARVLKNFGLRRLVLVAPRLARPQEAYKWARGAEEIVEGADVVEDLPRALASCSRAFATTRRRGKHRGGFVTPDRAAVETVVLAEAGQETAWVFGPESRGLATGEVALCSDRVVIPTAPEQPSLNLAQAVAVCGYEIHRAARAGGDAPRPPREATLAERSALYDHLRAELLRIGFLLPHTAESRMAGLQRLVERSRPTPKEVRLLRGLARQIGWAADRAGLPPEEDGPPEGTD